MRRFLKETTSLTHSTDIIKRRTERREKSFLDVMERAIYKNTRSPYLRLLSLAGYKLEDIKNLVKRVGIEETLRELVRDGIYLTFDEFKGRKNVTRNGKTFAFRESAFDNPFLSSYFGVETGATTSPGTRTMIDFDFLSREAAHRAVVLDMYDLLDAPCILWFPILPGNAGLMNFFRQAKIGRPPVMWFSQVDKRRIRPSIQDRFGTSFIVHMGRLFDTRVPSPEYVDLGDARRIATYLADTIERHSKCSFWTYVNSAVRICISAKNENLDLNGVRFFVVGEPITQRKLEEIRSCGAEAIPYYAFAESGIVAYGCANPDSPDDVHLLRDHVAAISHKKQVKFSDDRIDAFLFTSLTPEAPKILLNVETGDYGSIRCRECGCDFEAYGFTEHISNIRSFEKFTSEGMTFMISELVRIAEEVLPSKYAGSSSDYQVLEKYDQNGLTHIAFVISPRVGSVNESELKDTVLAELRKGKETKRLMAEIWSKAETIRVERMEPIPTKRGKIFPFRSEKSF